MINGLTESYSESEGPLWEVATSQTTCLCSRITGKVPFGRFNFTDTAFTRTLLYWRIFVRFHCFIFCLPPTKSKAFNRGTVSPAR